ncbi:MAG: alpha/beta fold hydrolase [Saprospiraceae bacterium]
MLKKILVWTAIILLMLVVIPLLVFYQSDIPVEKLKVKYTNAESEFVNINGMPIHFRDEGNPSDSVPLVLLHGTSASLLTWDSLSVRLKNNYRIVRFDLPAFGLTGPHPQKDYSIEMYLDVVKKMLANRQIKRCYLAGNSLGGLIAWRYALKHPDQVQKLILLDAAGYPVDGAKGNLGFNLARIPVLNQLLRVITPRFLVRRSLYDVYGDDSKVTDALVEQYYDLTCRAGNRQALIDRLRSGTIVPVEQIKEIKIPTLILWGDQDQLIPVKNAERFANDLPNDTLIILPGVGHVPMEETPEKVAVIMAAFLEK